MRWDKVILRKDGLWVEEWDRSKKRSHIFRLPEIPSDAILMAWNDGLEIQGTVRLRDVVKYLMQPLNHTMTRMISRLTGANLSEYFAALKKDDLENVSKKEHKVDDAKLVAIEVYKYFELSNADDVKRWDFDWKGLSAHGISAPDKEGNHVWAIEFTPWEELMHLPLRLRTEASIEKITYAKQAPRRVGFVKKGSKTISPGTGWIQDKRIVKRESFPVEVSYTLGEFFTGLFDELCFFWTPVKRQEEQEELLRRSNEVDEAKNDPKKRDKWYEMKSFPLNKKPKRKK